MTGDLVIVFQSRNHGAARERALVLRAVGIPGELEYAEGYHLLLVPFEMAEAAREELETYERENRRPTPKPKPLPLRPGAWLGVIAYAAILMLVAIFQNQDSWGVDWVEVGIVDGRKFRAGEWWRAATALTLHSDTSHLLGNLGFGAAFGLFAGRLLGGGLAWLSIVLAATAGNVLNILIQNPGHRSMGASTAVFAALGLFSAYSWMRRRHLPGWAYRSAPLVGGFLLLAYIGTGGERTDIVAHLTGFLSGLALGALYGRHERPPAPSTLSQRRLGAAAAGLLVAAWLLALP